MNSQKIPVPGSEAACRRFLEVNKGGFSVIVCVGKSSRGQQLFSALQDISDSYSDLGTKNPSRASMLVGASQSLTPNVRMLLLDAGRSRAALESQAKRIAEMIPTDGVEAVVVWGATLDIAKWVKAPVYIVTDGPYDPNDPSYPAEWDPRRWRDGYLKHQRDIFHGAAHVFTLSSWARDKVISVHGVPEDKVTRIGWGPLQSLGGVRLEKDDDPTFSFVSIGDDWHRKGMDVFADALTTVRDRRKDSDIRGLIVGKSGGFTPTARPGLTMIDGGTPSPIVQSLLRQADALVVASRFDASPHVIKEAQQYGTPVIGVDSCGVAEGVASPDGGLVVPLNDPSALAAAMEQILDADKPQARKSARLAYEASGTWAASASIVDGVVNPRS